MFPELSSIQRKRKILGLTQKDLAIATQISQSLIAKIERRSVIPNYEIAKRIFIFLEAAERENEKTAQNLMHKGVITIDVSDKIIKAVSLLKKHSISQLPVTKNGTVVGGITAKDIMDAPKNGCVKDFISDQFPTVSGHTPVSILTSPLP